MKNYWRRHTYHIPALDTTGGNKQHLETNIHCLITSITSLVHSLAQNEHSMEILGSFSNNKDLQLTAYPPFAS